MKLSDHIYADLGASISSDGEPPCELTLAAIANHYGASFGPVRTAVALLIADKRLEREKNGRLRLPTNGTRRDVSDVELTKKSINKRDQIQADIIKRSLCGETGFLREEWASDYYGIGRTALRPILSHLAGIGLLIKEPRRGWMIHEFDRGDLCSFIEVRELLELRALHLARTSLDNRILGGFLERNEMAVTHGDLELDNGLHDYWITLSSNRFIKSFFERDAIYYRTIFDFATPESHQVSEMAGQHCEILQALIRKRWSAANKALSNHIRSQQPIVRALIAKMRRGLQASATSKRA